MKFNKLGFTNFLESDSSGNKWKVMIIEEGLSKNGKYYPAEVLSKAAPLFEKSEVRFFEFDNKFFNHLPLSVEKIRPEGFPLQTAGLLENVKFETVNVDGRERKGLTGVLNFLDTDKARSLKETIVDAWKKGLKNFLGLSINADGEQMIRMMNGSPIAWVKDIKHVISTEFVTQPAAGGGLINLIESINKQEGAEKMFKKLLEALKAWKPKLLEGIDLANITQEETVGIFAKLLQESKEHKQFKDIEAMNALVKESKFEEAEGAMKKIVEADLKESQAAAAAAAAAKAGNPGAGNPSGVADPDAFKKQQESIDLLKKQNEELLANQKEQGRKMKLTECRGMLETRLAESKLPAVYKDKVKAHFKDKIFQEAELDAFIKAERDTLSKLIESKADLNFGDIEGTFVSKEPISRLQASLDLTMGYKPEKAEEETFKGVEKFGSLREAYVAYTDDPTISGRLGPKARARLREADSTTFAYALGFSMQRQMLRDYNKIDMLWRKIASTTPLKDFKLQERIRWGGFGQLPTVLNARTVAGTPIDSTTPTYPELGFPVDQEATYAAATKGGMVTLTRRMIIDDDLKILTDVPGKVARGAGNTLNRFVFDLMLNVSAGTINGGTIYDAIALYATAHKNYITAALGFDNLRTLLDMMYHQVEFGNKTLVVNNPLASGDTTLNVTTGEGQYFKAGDMLWIEGEILMVSSVSTDALTVTRGQFGTTAASHAQNVIVYKATEILAIQNPNLWVPRSLRSTALALKGSEKNPESAENAINTIRDSFEPIVSPFLRGDENNYYLSAQLSDIQGIEVGFINGQEEPEIIVQDSPTEGNVFVYDTIRYKVRHEYGGAVVDFRAFAGAIV